MFVPYKNIENTKFMRLSQKPAMRRFGIAGKIATVRLRILDFEFRFGAPQRSDRFIIESIPSRKHLVIELR
jgi:hypothetical protein